MKVQSQKISHQRLLTDGPLNSSVKSSEKHSSGSSHRCLYQEYLPRIKKTLTQQSELPICILNNPNSKAKLSSQLSNHNKASNGSNCFYLSTEESSTNKTQNFISSKKAIGKPKVAARIDNLSSFINNLGFPSQNNKLKLLKKKTNQSLNKENQITVQEATLSKAETKDATITPLRNLSNFDSVKSPEELHLAFVHLIQKGKAIQQTFDADTESFNEGLIIPYEW